MAPRKDAAAKTPAKDKKEKVVADQAEAKPEADQVRVLVEMRMPSPYGFCCSSAVAAAKDSAGQRGFLHRTTGMHMCSVGVCHSTATNLSCTCTS